MAQGSMEFPAGGMDPSALSFFKSFYQVTDEPLKHEAYAEMYTPDATLIVASTKVEGYDQIVGLRKVMWDGVANRKHTVDKFFPFGPNAREFMLYGRVEYVSPAGQSVGKEWAAHAQLAEAGGQLKLKFYQVYLDMAAA